MKKVCIAILVITAVLGLKAADSTVAILNLLNSKSAGSPKAYAEALKIVKADAEKGKALQQFVYAVICPEDGKSAEYLEASRPKIKKLAEQRNNALAWYLLSLETQDMKMLKKAVDGGNVQALNAWGTVMNNTVQRDPNMDDGRRAETRQAVFEVFKKAAEKGDPNGLYNLGMCYMNGIGCEKDYDLGFEAFKAAAEKGHPEAINNIGGCYRDGIVVEQNMEKATRWFKRSADFENVYGMINYGLSLQNGEGIEQDEKAAIKYFERAAKDGSPEAVNLLGVCYMNGRGVEQDEAKAVEYFLKSAKTGFPPAMENLCECYNSGRGVKKDAMESMAWKLRAKAIMGDKAAAKWLEQNGYPVL